jgi:hypothetical protein
MNLSRTLLVPSLPMAFLVGCILNPQPLPPDNYEAGTAAGESADAGRAGSTPTATSDGGGLKGRDSGVASPGNGKDSGSKGGVDAAADAGFAADAGADGSPLSLDGAVPLDGSPADASPTDAWPSDGAPDAWAADASDAWKP